MAVSSVSEIDTTFLDDVTELAETSATCGTAATGANSRVWQLPPTGTGEGEWPGDPSDIPGLVAAFDRDDANQVYTSAIADPGSPGTTGDLVAQKSQIDYVGIMERGFRARMASPVRCLVHASATRIGHGDPAGVFLNGIVGYVTDVIAAAKLPS